MKPSLPVIFLMGPTASGKTDLAIALHENLPVELISVDSALIYRTMDIGTAKPTAEEQARAPHRLIDICDPAESYSAMQFRADALREISAIHQQGKIPLLVGGTMLYYKALMEGLSPLPAADAAIRAEIEADALRLGWAALHAQLAQVDPVSAARINPNDSQRINRALEVYRLTGQSLTALSAQKGEPLPFNTLQFAIYPEDRAVLHHRIEQRFEKMIANGFQAEVEKLMLRGDLHPQLPSIRCVGYRQMWSHLAGEISLDEAIFQGICATRQLAKRQITWLRGWNAPLTHLDSLQPERALATAIAQIQAAR